MLGLDEDWSGLEKNILRQSFALDEKSDIAAATATAGLAMRQLKADWAETEAAAQEPAKNSEPLVAAMRRSSAKLAGMSGGPGQPKTGSGSPHDANLAFQAARVAKRAAQLHWSLYDAGETAHVVPALEPTALEADRYRSEIHPWIGLQALLQGSNGLLSGYPRDAGRQDSRSWAEARAAYRDRDLKDRAAKFSEAMEQFAAEVRTMSNAIEPARRELVIQERDDGLLDKTAYPAAIVTNVEFCYNRIDPFFWSGCVSLAAAGILALSFLVAARKPLFWTGIGALVLAIVLVAGGFLTRDVSDPLGPGHQHVRDDGVGCDVCRHTDDLGDVLPLLSLLGRTAWNLTALPGTSRANRSVLITLRLLKFTTRSLMTTSRPASRCRFGGPPPGCSRWPSAWASSSWRSIFSACFQPDSWNSEYRLASFLPRADIGSTLPTASSLLVWLSSIFVTVIVTWYVPRLIPAAIIAIPLTIAMARRTDGQDRAEKVYRWRGVALAGAVATTAAAWAAHNAPFPKEIQALMPVLRSNFWLGIHVLTIVTSYGGALAAWVISNATLGCYLFGQYRVAPVAAAARANQATLLGEEASSHVLLEEISESDSVATASRLRCLGGVGVPPALSESEGGDGPRWPVTILAGLNYRVIQITVLLLAAGTILGGLWADVSWGRSGVGIPRKSAP